VARLLDEPLESLDRVAPVGFLRAVPVGLEHDLVTEGEAPTGKDAKPCLARIVE
jgi:hypothetical protein